VGSAPCRIRVTDPSGATSPTTKRATHRRVDAGGGAVVFRRGATGAFSNSLTLPVQLLAPRFRFFVAGKFGRPSVNNADLKIEARNGTTLVGSVA